MGSSGINSSKQNHKGGRIQIDAAKVREMLETGEVKSIQLISTTVQIADAFTKRGAATSPLINTLEQGSCLTIDLVAEMITSRRMFHGYVKLVVGCQVMFPIQRWSRLIFVPRSVKICLVHEVYIQGDEVQDSRKRKKGIRLINYVQRHSSKTGSCK